MAKRLIADSERHIERHRTCWSFNDWEELDTYDLDARIELTAWLVRNSGSVAQAHIFSRNRLVVGGVSLAQLVVGDTLHAHQDRDTYEAALAEAVQHGASTPSTRAASIFDVGEGTVVDRRYRCIRPLGQGASGTVHLAEDTQLERLTALKFIDASTDPGARGSALSEARALASIRHDNVAAVYATGAHRHSPYVAMEFIDGTSFSDIIGMHLERGVNLPLVPALSMLAKVARGLGAVHAAGLVHRDVKPENVVVEHVTGRPVLVDFGLAEAPVAHSDVPRLGGTPAFMAPEVCSNEAPASAQSDFYSWGVMAFELLTGTLPFASCDLLGIISDHVFTTPPLPSSRRPDLVPVDDLLRRTLAKNPRDRPSSGSEIALYLESLVARIVGHPEKRPERLRALVVTSDPALEAAVAEAAGRAFTQLPLKIVVAPDGRRALEAAELAAPDVVLVGSLLTDMHGIEFLSRLRAKCLGPALEFVLQPGSMDDEWRFRALGVQRFIESEDPSAVTAQLIEAGLAHGW